MSHFGILSSFDHTIHTWQNYKQRISQWFIANDIDDVKDSAGVKRRAILLSALSDCTYQLAADLALPKQLTQVPYEDVLVLLDNHFTPKKCGFGERYNFYSASQEPDETYSQWAARLRGLTTHCGFLYVEEALRDRFVMGLQPGPEKDKLFARDLEELTLAKAVELAESVHSARKGAAASSSREAVHAPVLGAQLYKIGSDKFTRSDKEMCSVCGYKNHKTAQCRFVNYKCKKCNVTGHLRRMCKKINFVGTGESNESDDDGKAKQILCSHKGEPITLSVSVGSVSLKFEIDTGSAVTAISDVTYKKYFKSVPLSLTSDQLFTYTGRTIHCLGIVKLPFTYLNKTHGINVRVIRDGGPPILGRDFISIFKLQMLQINLLNQSDNMVEQLKSLYPTVFSDDLGMFTKYRVKLQLKDNAKPVFFKFRPVAFALRNKVNDELDRLVRIGVLEPTQHSEYASPIVPILKRDGTIRLCADYSVSVNKQLVIEQYPLPTARELFTKLHGGQQFSKLDLTQAYSQFVLDEESQKITCINTHRGLFKYTRLVFGLASAPAIFQRAMECLLSGLDGVMCMLDDICITGETKTQHLERLHEVLKRLQEAGLTVRKDKCVFFADKVEYLGYTIDKNGLSKSQQKVKAIIEAPIPTNVTKLKSFLGLVNYYRNFVPNASSILSPFYSLLQKGSKWEWQCKHDDAFNVIKKCLASDQVLAHYNQDAKILLTVDASPSGLGAILSQVGSDGVERPVCFASRTLNSAEKRYSQIQKEATAIIFGVRRFHQYLYGRATPFILRTDHKPLLSIFGPYRGIPEVSANRLQRYAIFLSGYNYTIEYIRSADNSADYLSRASLPDNDPTPRGRRGYGLENSGSDSLEAIEDRASYVNFVVDGSLPVTLNEIRNETHKDTILCEIISYIINGWPKRLPNMFIKPYFLCKTQLSYENGCVMRGHKIVIPESIRTKLLLELHKSHIGVVKTKAEARSRFWFPGIDKAIENMIARCDICLQLRQAPARVPLAVWPHPPQPFYRIHIDFLGPIHNRSYLIIVDAYSKWVEAYDMGKSTSTSSVVGKLCEYMARFGLPHTIVSDNGTQFTSMEFKTFCLSNGVSHVTSPAYHPASNGQAESYVKVVKKGIKSCILSTSNDKSIHYKLTKYLFDYRNSIHSTTGCSPAQIVFGHKLRSRLDLINPIQTPPSASSATLARHVEHKQSLQCKAFKTRRTYSFKPGDLVLYKKYNINKQYSWTNGVIVKRIGKVIYIVKDMLTSCSIKKHKNQLLPFNGTVSNMHQASNCPIDLEDITLQETTTSQSTPPATAASGKGEQEAVVDNESQTKKSIEDDEFSEAIEPKSDTAYQESSSRQQLQQDRQTGSGKILRSVPRVDYKKFY